MDEQLVERILTAIDSQRVIDFEQSLVRIPSFTTEETPLATHIAGFLEKVGQPLEVRLDEVSLAGGGTSYNVVARLPGAGGGPTLLLFGHMDHDPILGRNYARFEGWKHDPFGGVIEGNWLYGKGCQDEKGCLTGIAMAAKALVDAHVQLKGDVLFIFVQGHKRRSTGILHLLQDGLKADFAINTENCGNAVVPAFVGRSEGRVHIRAPELHFHLKDTFPELRERKTAFELLNEIQRAIGPEMQAPGQDTWLTFVPHPDLPGYPQLRVELVEFHGIDYVVLDFHVRTVPGMTGDSIRQDLQGLLAKFQARYPYAQIEVEWPIWEHRSAVAVPHDSRLVQTLARWQAHVAGTVAVDAHAMLGAAADASHTAAAGIPTILYGPGGGETDKEYRLKAYLNQGPPDERIALSDIVVAAKVLALTAADLCG